MTALAANAVARRDIATDITQKILDELAKGVMPWRAPWTPGTGGVFLPRRVTDEPYRGANTVLLWAASNAKGFASPFWLTFNQAIKLGASVRRGERGETVIYYGQAAGSKNEEGTSESDAQTSFRFLKSYIVFNADQIDNLPEGFHATELQTFAAPIEMHEAWFAKLEIARTQTRDRAFYSPARDVIGMPPVGAFDNAEAYAATLDHEAVHATGAQHRLDRDFSKRFGDAAYAAEELVAEIGAAILGVHLHLPPSHIHDHAAYIGHWIKLLENDKRAFLTAAAKAQAAVDWLLSKSPAPDFAMERKVDVAA